MPRWAWFERQFTFGFPIEKRDDLVERFRGLPARVEDRVRGLPRAALVWSDGGWSIQENVGHLLALESLWSARLEDFLSGRPVLRAADLENRATHEARFNERDIDELASALREARLGHAAQLEALTDAHFARTALHPRLNSPMRLVDAVAFVCEHDDFHLARIGELIRKQRGQSQAWL